MLEGFLACRITFDSMAEVACEAAKVAYKEKIGDLQSASVEEKPAPPRQAQRGLRRSFEAVDLSRDGVRDFLSASDRAYLFANFDVTEDMRRRAAGDAELFGHCIEANMADVAEVFEAMDWDALTTPGSPVHLSRRTGSKEKELPVPKGTVFSMWKLVGWWRCGYWVALGR